MDETTQSLPHFRRDRALRQYVAALDCAEASAPATTEMLQPTLEELQAAKQALAQVEC